MYFIKKRYNLLKLKFFADEKYIYYLINYLKNNYVM